MPPRTRVDFPPFHLDLTNHELWRGEARLALRPKPFALLAYLATHPHRLVPHAELAKELWPDTHVGDGLLRGYVRDVRTVLEDDAASPRYVETVARLGYRFVAPIGPESADVPVALVGRSAEIATLDRRVERAIAGARQVVFVTGEAGIGKTALVEAVLARIRGRMWWAQGQCVEHFGPSEPYLPLLEAVARLGRLPLRDDVAALLPRLAPTWVLQVPSLAPQADVDDLRQRVQGATRERMLREFVEAIEETTTLRPLVLVLDDLQWSDDSTLDVLASLARRREPSRLLVVGTYRPADVPAGHPLAAVTRELRLHGLCEEIALPALDVEGVRACIARRIPAERLPSDLAPALHAVTGGNPLFVRSLLDDWITRGVVVEGASAWTLVDAPTRVPDSVRQTIERQLDRLPAETCRVLEAASVVGREFSARTVAAVLDAPVASIDAACEDLVLRDVVLRAAGIDDADGAEVAGRYAFVHALHRQVLYERLGAARRVRLHRQVAGWMATAYGASAREHAAELAMHCERGQDPRAVSYLALAAQNAVEKHAYREAVAVAERGLAMLGTGSERRERAREELALQMARGTALVTTKGYAAPEVEEAFAVASTLARDVDVGPERAFALAGLFRFAFARARFGAARAIAEEVLTLAEAVEPSLACVAHGMLGPPLMSLGELGAAREHLERAVAICDLEQARAIALRHGDDPGLTALAFLAIALWLLGHPDEAAARGREGEALAERLGSPYGRAFAGSFATWIHVRRGDVAAVRASSEALAALAADEGFTFFRAEAAIFHGWALAEGGAIGEGIEQIAEGLATHQAAGVAMGRPSHLGLLAEACLRGERADDALAAAAEGLALVASTDERTYEAELLRLKGEAIALRKGGRRKAAEAPLREALAVARRHGARSWELRAAVSLCRHAKLLKDPSSARSALADVVAWFGDGADTADLRAARAILI